MLEVDGLRKRLGPVVAVDAVSFRTELGRIVAVTGENGAGKSTLLRLLAGVLVPDRGRAELDGQSLLGRAPEIRRKVGYVPEAADAPPYLTGAELLRLVAAAKECERIDGGLLERLGLRAIVHRRVGEYSLGERRRLCLAAALLGAPGLLLLDEPGNGLDAEGVERLAELLEDERAAGTGVLLISHDAALCSRLADEELRMGQGRIVGA